MAKITDLCKTPGTTGSTLRWTAPECLPSQSNAGSSPASASRSPNYAKSTFAWVPSTGADLLPSDVYSYGVVMFECLTRKEPFEGLDPMEIAAGVASGSLSLQTPQGCGAEMAVLLRECLSFDRMRRPPFAEIERRLAATDPSQVASAALLCEILHIMCKAPFTHMDVDKLHQSISSFPPSYKQVGASQVISDALTRATSDGPMESTLVQMRRRSSAARKSSILSTQDVRALLA